jgi:DUF4097 and DUF4098 domain-containing protein YvlB
MNKYFVATALTLGLMLCAGAGFSQTKPEVNKPEVITVPLSRPGEPVTLEIGIMSARIEVIGEDRKDAQFTITMAGGERKIKTPSGMKTLAGAGGALSVEEEDNEISIDSEARMTKIEIVARIPRRANLDLSTVNDGEIIVRDVTGALELENVNGPITATNINGSVIAESVNDAIKVAFTSVSTSGATSISSLNGDILVSLPPTVGAELRIDNSQGQIESDFELDVKPTKPTIERTEGRGGVSVIVEDVVVATVNGGGPVIKMKTLNGNIRIGKTGK